MNAGPSCRGVLLETAVRAVRAAISRGSVERARIEARLEEDDLRFLDERVEPTQWYPVGALGRYLALAAELAGGADDDAYERIGAGAFHLLRGSGRCPQLDFEENALRSGSPADFKRFSRLLSSVWGAFYDFSALHLDLPETGNSDTGWLAEVHWKDVGVLDRSLCPVTRGFIRALFERATGSPVRVDSYLVTRDHFLFRVCVEAG